MNSSDIQDIMEDLEDEKLKVIIEVASDVNHQNLLRLLSTMFEVGYITALEKVTDRQV